LRVDPSIFPYLDVIAITHNPESALFEDPTSLKNAKPRVAGSRPLFSLKEIAVREIFSFQGSGHEGLRFSDNPPPLFRKQSFIECSEIPKS
jgi:hypothetical protein